MNLRLVVTLSTLFAFALAGQTASKQPSAATTKTQLSVDDVKLAVYQRTATPSHTPIKANSKDSKVYDVDRNVKVQLKFVVKDDKKNALLVQQAFVAFVHKDSDREVIFVAEPETGSKSYTAEVDMKTQEKNFDGLNGTYNVRLVIGDANAANAIDWNLVDVNVKTTPVVSAPTKKSQIVNYEPLKEINHLFREPEKRPLAVISDAFTLLCAAPMLLLFIMWLRIGFNLNNIQISLSSLGFHGGLFGIFALYFTFWMQLDMFETLKYLAIIGVPTFIFGNRLLRSLNESRKHSTKAE